MGLKQYFGRALVAGLLVGSAMASVENAQAITAKECHAKFRAAKSTLNGQTYKAFKAEQCGEKTASAKASSAKVAAEEPKKEAPATTAAPAASGSTTAAPAAPAERPAPAANAAPRAAAVTSGNVVFPSAVSPQYAKLSEGIARRKTCLDQYNANKETGGNGGLKWIQKGGGYYSECNTKLK